MSGGLRLDRLVGRVVYTGNGRRLGRLHDFRAEQRGADWIIIEYVIGTVGLFERLGLAVRLILGMRGRGGYIASWNQLDLTNPEHLKITCAVSELQKQ
jgi:hypothetical protein